MPDVKISAGADPGTLTATDKVPLARSASTTAYAATMAELATYANGAYTPNYFAGTPSMDGAGAPGAAAFVSRGDHVHPSDTSRAPLASPTFTGTPAAPTPPPGDSSTRLATTAFATTTFAPLASPALTGNPTAPTPTVGDNDTSLATTAFVQAAVAPALAPAQNNIGRNELHNSMFNVAQRGNGAFTGNNTYTADRWAVGLATDVLSVNRVTLGDADRASIGDEAATWALQATFTGNVAAGAYSFIEQRSESVRRLSGKTITVSFWANATAALKFGVNLAQVFGTGGSPSAPVFAQATGQAATLATTWARYSMTFAMPSIAGKTLGTNGDDYTTLRLNYSSGATGNAGAGNVGVQSGTINLWGVQLEIGTQATPLEKPDPRYDLANCQRFYQAGYMFSAAYQIAGGAVQTSAMLQTPMRAAPTVTVQANGSTNLSGFAASTSSGAVLGSGTATATGGVAINFTYTASADL